MRTLKYIGCVEMKIEFPHRNYIDAQYIPDAIHPREGLFTNNYCDIFVDFLIKKIKQGRNI